MKDVLKVLPESFTTLTNLVILGCVSNNDMWKVNLKELLETMILCLDVIQTRPMFRQRYYSKVVTVSTIIITVEM